MLVWKLGWITSIDAISIENSLGVNSINCMYAKVTTAKRDKETSKILV
jgi:hypothetical protein